MSRDGLEDRDRIAGIVRDDFLRAVDWLPPGVEYADLPGNVADDPEDAGPLDELEDLQIEIELSGTFTAELLERRDNLIRSLLRDGTSVRSVATAAGLSEVRVRQIRREEPSQ